LGQTNDIGKELQHIIAHRPTDPNLYLKKLKRFDVYLNQLSRKDQFNYMEQLIKVYGSELHDFKKALGKTNQFSSLYSNSAAHRSFSELLKCKVYLSAPDHSTSALEAIEKALGKKTIESPFGIEDLEAANLYSYSLTQNKNYYKALKIQERILSEIILPNHLPFSQNQLELALTFSRLEKTDSCLYYLYRSLEHADLEKNDSSIAQSSFELGMFLKYSSDKKKALNYLLRSYNRITFISDDSKRVKLCKVIGELYKLENNAELALRFKEQELRYVDSLKTNEKSRLDAIYSYQLNKKREKHLNTQSAFIKATEKINWGLAGFISFGLLLIFFLIRGRKKKYIRIDTKNGIGAIVEQLKNPDSELPKEKEKIIHELISDLQQSVSSKNWEDFEIEFSQKHPAFQIKLEASHPKLSSNERKLCMCLAENLTTKDISPLTGQNAHAINIARGRLRKKLGIDHKDLPIPEYLSQFL